MATASVLLEGLAFGESPRWHDGALWVCDWGAQELLRFGADGSAEVVARVDSFPFCIDWLPDPTVGCWPCRRPTQAVLALADDGTLTTFCALDGSPPRRRTTRSSSIRTATSMSTGAASTSRRGGAAPGSWRWSPATARPPTGR